MVTLYELSETGLLKVGMSAARHAVAAVLRFGLLLLLALLLGLRMSALSIIVRAGNWL